MNEDLETIIREVYSSYDVRYGNAIVDLKQRIDKAIEYIERVMAIIKEQPRTDVDDFWILEKLQIFLDILKGEENDNSSDNI